MKGIGGKMEKANEEGREIGIDVLKGIGVILVMLGHLIGTNNLVDVVTYIYAFHMPLFFFISGYLKYKKGCNIGVLANIKKQAKHILIPYFILLTISILFTETFTSYIQTNQLFAKPTDLLSILKAYFLSGGYLDQIPCANFPLWYLPLYFITAIIFDILVRNKKVEKFLPIFIIILIAVTVPFQNLIPGRPAFHINILPASLAFMGLGYLFNKYIKKQNLPDIVAYACLIIGILISQFNGGNISEIKSMIYYVGAIGSIYFFYAITKDNNNKVLAYIGKNSLIIYGIHALIFTTLWIFTPLAQKIGNGLMFKTIEIIYALIISITICNIIDFIKEKRLNKKLLKE